MTQSAARATGMMKPSADIEAIVSGTSGDPFAVLGPHAAGGGETAFNVFHPAAETATIIDASTGSVLLGLDKIDPRGFFSAVTSAQVGRYHVRFTRGSDTWEIDDPYRFAPILGELDLHLFGEGRHRKAYDHLGAHPMEIDGVTGVAFAVWAPNASRASVVGLFNGWDGRVHPMRKHPGAGIFEIFIPGIQAGEYYKYELLDSTGRLLPARADPYGQGSELPPGTASRVHDGRAIVWNDERWMQHRAAANDRSAPISIYEVHLASWRRGSGDSLLDYGRLADELIPYVQDLGFTHIELMPISEYPFGGSWGYQPVGLFSPTARFGPPEAFARFVDRFHEAGIGVLVDWVPAHFPSDAHGLARFDGTALYEHEDPRRGFHKDWNTLIYNYGRREVANFLESNAQFWLANYHIDGLRVDAVASMLYLDYSRQPGEWVPNINNGRENLEAVDFLQSMNTRVYADNPGAITIAEESTAWPQVSRPVDGGGLGFGYKWNMGWMHDTLQYISQDPIHRKHHHDKLTFGLIYAWNENFILPISHDEVVHGKGSLIGKMPGDRWQRFANLRAYLAFMWTHPGKKLLFMGCEFAQEAEWSHDHSLDWHLLADGAHRGIQNLVRDLNKLYRTVPALHQLDCEPEGFTWIDGGNANDSVLAFLRNGRDGEPPALVVCNFTPVVRENYAIGVPHGGRWIERLNSDASAYGGTDVGNSGARVADANAQHGQPYSLRLTLPPLGVVVFVQDGANGGGQ
ncbi:MAG: 1,4-alpha-glucan branching protein GlgB [Hyphomicrobiaceae bacterium]|nr:1,4-alpha-glucan branching protein GlgB [Hyphomicrobiaceae bacterium]